MQARGVNLTLRAATVAALSVLCGCTGDRGDARMPACASASASAADQEGRGQVYEVTKSEAEWRKQLTSEQYRITREAGTEPAFQGRYYKHKGEGVYRCVCCGAELFSSAAKYDSGSGWPSFWQPVAAEKVEKAQDTSLGMTRTEVRCSRCGAHLGHVFDDGPKPTGLRYCVNSAALQFEERKGEGAAKGRQ